MDHAATARANALHCEAKKHAYRQTQDGVVVSFVLHPQDIPDNLATAPLGTRYMIALVEVNDDETPKVQPISAPAIVADATASNGARAWRTLSLPQQAGIRCNEEAFHKFLGEKIAPDADFDNCTPQAAIELAASIVRHHCIVQSRGDIRPNHPSARLWRELDEKFQAWMREAEMVPA
jgi:hypothetical protein